MKVKVSVSIDKIEYERARKNGLNTSQICTNALKVCNDAIEGAIGKPSFSVEPFQEKRVLAGGEGFEPSTPNLGGWCSLRAMRKFPSTPHFGGCYRNIAIRTELLAHSGSTNKGSKRKNITNR